MTDGKCALGSRQIDALVAQKVFDKASCLCAHGASCPIHCGPHYSEQLGAAMKVFDRMRELGHRWLLNADDAGFHLRRVINVEHDLKRDEKRYTADRPLGTAKTPAELPRVICDAALGALMVWSERITVGIVTACPACGGKLEMDGELKELAGISLYECTNQACCWNDESADLADRGDFTPPKDWRVGNVGA